MIKPEWNNFYKDSKARKASSPNKESLPLFNNIPDTNKKRSSIKLPMNNKCDRVWTEDKLQNVSALQPMEILNETHS